MKGRDIVIGGVYTAKVSGTVQRVRVLAAGQTPINYAPREEQEIE